MHGWEELRQDLIRIRDDHPRALQSYPDPSDPIREGPVSVELAAWAEDLAAELHHRYAGYVQLTVGAFGYPDRTGGDRTPPPLPTEPAATLGLTVAPVAPLEVRSGDSTHADVEVGNDGSVARDLHTMGFLRSFVVDDRSEVVGGFVGAVNVPLVPFRIEPGCRSRVPVLLGASSLRADLGYALPPGEWQAVVVLETPDGRVLSPAMPLTITRHSTSSA